MKLSGNNGDEQMQKIFSVILIILFAIIVLNQHFYLFNLLSTFALNF